MGLKTLFSFSSQELDVQAGEAARRETSPAHDQNSAWKVKRLETLENRKVFYYASVVLLLGFYGFACYAMREPWKLVATGAFPVFCVFERVVETRCCAAVTFAVTLRGKDAQPDFQTRLVNCWSLPA